MKKHVLLFVSLMLISFMNVNASSITITAPADNGNYYQGGNIEFVWSFSGGLEYIELVATDNPTDENPYFESLSSAINVSDGMYILNIPNDQPLGEYAFKFVDFNTGEDVSNIITGTLMVAPGSSETIEIDTPADKAQFNTMDEMSFTWTVSDGVDKMMIQVSENNADFEVIELDEGYINSALTSYNLGIHPGVGSSSFYLKLVDFSNPTIQSQVIEVIISDIHFAEDFWTYPEHQATGVSVDLDDFYGASSGSLFIGFEESIVIDPNKEIRLRSDDVPMINTLLTNTAVVDQFGLEINLSAILPLRGNTDYYVTMEPGAVTDEAGNPFAGITNGFSFKTDGATDIVLSEKKEKVILITSNAILMQEDVSSIAIYSASGTLIDSRSNLVAGSVISTNDFSKGLYLIQIENSEVVKMIK